MSRVKWTDNCFSKQQQSWLKNCAGSQSYLALKFKLHRCQNYAYCLIFFHLQRVKKIWIWQWTTGSPNFQFALVNKYKVLFLVHLYDFVRLQDFKHRQTATRLVLLSCVALGSKFVVGSNKSFFGSFFFSHFLLFSRFLL